MESVHNRSHASLVRNNKGSVFLVTLILSVAVAVAIMVMAGQLNFSISNQKSRVLYNEYVELVESVRNQLDDPMLCAQMLSGVIVDNSQLQTNTGANISRIRVNFGSSLPQYSAAGDLRPNWVAKPGGVTLDRITAVRSRYVNAAGVRQFTVPSDMQLADAAANRFRIDKVDLILVSSQPQINIFNPAREYLWINLNLVMNGNRIVGCHGRSSAAGQCLAMGGAYDWRSAVPSYPPGLIYPQQRCHPDTKIFYHSGGIIMAPDLATATARCLRPFRPSPVGVFMDEQTRWVCSWRNEFR